MLTVHVLAEPAIMGVVSSVLTAESEVTVGLRTNNVREAVSFRYAVDDLLIVDDALLLLSPGLVSAVAEVHCHKLVVGPVADGAAARRALVLQSISMIEPTRLVDELPNVVAQVMPPSEKLDAWVAAVYSAKGGVGKSTVALNLAWALAVHSEHSVALVDCDPLGDIGAMIQDKPGATLVDMVHGLSAGLTPEKALQSLHQVKALGLTVVPSAVTRREAGLVRPEDLEKVLQILKESHAYVVLDLATGLTDVNLTALDGATQAIVMSAPERVTLSAVRRSLEVLRRLYPEKLSLLLNRADSDTGLDEGQVQEALNQPVRYVLPSGGSGPVRAANRGRPLVLAEPKNPLARSIMEMAQEIVGAREGVRRRPRRWYAR